MLRPFAHAFLLAISTVAAALEPSDAGSYAVIHRDGHVTDFLFFVSVVDGNWRIERRNPDGRWNNVTCEEECKLNPSTAKDLVRFFPPQVLSAIVPSCVHNMAFAFCTYAPRTNPEDRRQVVVALVTPTPTPVHLKKVSNERIGP